MTMFGEDEGAVAARVRALEMMDPVKRKALLEASYLPAELDEFNRQRGDTEETYKKQMLQAQQMAFTPVEAQGRTPFAQGANLMANALRMFGGLALGSMRENDLKKAREESASMHEGILKKGKDALGASMDLETDYLGGGRRRSPAAEALLNYRPSPGGGYST